MRGGGVKGRLEFFQKFIRFGSGVLPSVGNEIINRGNPPVLVDYLSLVSQLLSSLVKGARLFSVSEEKQDKSIFS